MRGVCLAEVSSLLGKGTTATALLAVSFPGGRNHQAETSLSPRLLTLGGAAADWEGTVRKAPSLWTTRKEQVSRYAV